MIVAVIPPKPMHRLPLVILMLLILAGCGDTNGHIPDLASLPKLAGGEGVAGSLGEPPSDVGSLVSPIKLVDAGGFLDGGTTWVALSDANNSRAVFCVTQDCFPSDIPFNSMYVGAKHADNESGRLPLSKTEALMLISALAAALENEKFDVLKTDIGESILQEKFTVSPENRTSYRTWSRRYAHNALARLSAKKHFELVDRQKLDARIARMTSIDIHALSGMFRKTPENARAKIWSQLKHCFPYYIRGKNVMNQRSAIGKLLGESDPSTVAQCKLTFTHLDTEQYKNMLAYLVKQEPKETQYLVVSFRGDEAIDFRVFTVNHGGQ